MADSDDKPVKGNLKLLLEKFESMKANNDTSVNRKSSNLVNDKPNTSETDIVIDKSDNTKTNEKPETNVQDQLTAPEDSTLFGQGLTRSTSLKLLEHTEDMVDQEKTVNGRALYENEIEEVGELAFKPGFLITKITVIDDNWARGECDGSVGIFPLNYVRILN